MTKSSVSLAMTKECDCQWREGHVFALPPGSGHSLSRHGLASLEFGN